MYNPKMTLEWISLQPNEGIPVQSWISVNQLHSLASKNNDHKIPFGYEWLDFSIFSFDFLINIDLFFPMALNTEHI